MKDFLRAQLDLQRLDERTFATRSELGLSHIYQILRGDRIHTRADTFDKIARGLGMTPAEMAVAMGKAALSQDPDEAEVIALFRAVPEESRHAAKHMLRGLSITPTTRLVANRRKRQAVNPPPVNDPRPGQRPNHASDGPLTKDYRRRQRGPLTSAA